MKKYLLLILWSLCVLPTSGWELHPLMADPIFRTMPELSRRDSIPVVTLHDFLMAVEDSLSKTLAATEKWAQASIEWYHPLPRDLVFQPTGNRNDITLRFIHAIRINPEAKLINYLQLLPGEAISGRTILPAQAVTPAKNPKFLYNVTFVALDSGSVIDPLSVLVTATDEPDHGLDIGLYADNQTPAGAIYGFGVQPFGNPNLDYGSQAPFHMGFFHEARIVNALAPYLQESYVTYRIELYRNLSSLAFRLGQDYWGWRFMGWGLHYLADLTQPYHARALPGTSTLKMITMNALDILGFSGMKDRAIQLVSNRHTALEVYERQVLENVYYADTVKSSNYIEVKAPDMLLPEYAPNVPRQIISRISAANARKMDRMISRTFPDKFVNDSAIELGDDPELYQILAIVKQSDVTTTPLDALITDEMNTFATYGQAYLHNILDSGRK